MLEVAYLIIIERKGFEARCILICTEPCYFNHSKSYVRQIIYFILHYFATFCSKLM